VIRRFSKERFSADLVALLRAACGAARFDRGWEAWEDGAVPAGIAQHEEGRARLLAALERGLADASPCRILEVGCGSAIDLAILAHRVPRAHAVGLDISAEALRVARAAVARVGSRAAFCRGDLFRLPFADRSFGVVFSQGVLEHFRDPEAALREQVRVLAHGGALLVSVPQRWTGYTAHKRRAIRRGTWPWGWEGEFTARDLRAMGRAEGLECVEVFGSQYWRAWGEPAWILRDLYGKIHRRNPLAALLPFAQLAGLNERLWGALEARWGHLFLQNVVAVFRKPAALG
jgi:SAM-dependent methyltransferase